MAEKLIDKSAIELRLQEVAKKIELLKDNLEVIDGYRQLELSLSIMRVIGGQDFIMACRWGHSYIETIAKYVSEIDTLQQIVIDRLNQSHNMLDASWLQLIDTLNNENITIHKNIQTVEVLNELLIKAEKILPPKTICCATSEEFVSIREKVNPDDSYLKSNLENTINQAREKLRSRLKGIASKRGPARKYLLEVIKEGVSQIRKVLKSRVDAQFRIYIEQKILSSYNQALKESALFPQYNIEESEIRKQFFKDSQEIYKTEDVSYPLASQSYYEDLANAIAVADIKTHVFDSDEFRTVRTKDREEKISQYTEWIFSGLSNDCHEYLYKIFEMKKYSGSQDDNISKWWENDSGLPYYVINDWTY